MTDETLEQIVAGVLRTGVLLAASVVLAGGACYLMQHGNELAVYGTFHGQPASYRAIRRIVTAVLAGDCRALIQFGLVILIATPIARVVFSMIAFTMERDRTYMIVTAIVLGILTFSLIAGAA
jgi:uncharacterized membrane protein